VQKPAVDPLADAVENAWRAGIAVVVAGGNRGGATKLLNPATDPFVIAVGAEDDNGTAAYTDDKVATFTSVGDSARKLDFVATGRSIVSLRAPGSYIDTNYPAARVGTDYFRGSGSSQAAAVTASAVAIMFQLFPKLTPDQVKGLLRSMARPVASNIFMADVYNSWHGYTADPKSFTGVMAPQKGTASTGTGSLEAARGTSHVTDGTSSLTGENDIFGPFSTSTWAAASAKQSSWAGGAWMGHDWSGSGWAAGPGGMQSWAGRAWSGRAWSGRAWSSDSWTALGWQGAGWS
jgi:serine protease AprX